VDPAPAPPSSWQAPQQFVDEQPVGNHVEVKEATELAGTVDYSRKRLISSVRPRSVGIDVDGDTQESEIATLRALLQELLPHGQLFTALSPVGPHEHEQSLTTVVVRPDDSSVKAGQGDRR